MGCSASVGLTSEELEEYSLLLYLHKSEILQIYGRLKEASAGDTIKATRFSQQILADIFPELKWNPYLSRILTVFSSERDNCLSFEDILDLHSALSPNCPVNVKAAWAFKIFDFDADGEISHDDIKEMVDTLIQGTDLDDNIDLPSAEKDEIAKSILIDLDLDGTGGVTQAEFVHAVMKMPEFSHSFTLRV